MTASREFTKCTCCGHYGWFPGHRCPPAWYCQIIADSDGSDHEHARLIYADEADDAAMRLVSEWDCYDSEYPIAQSFGDRTLTVAVWSRSDWHDQEADLDELSSYEDWLNDPSELDADEIAEIKANIEGLKKAIADRKPQTFVIGGEMVQRYYVVQNHGA